MISWPKSWIVGATLALLSGNASRGSQVDQQYVPPTINGGGNILGLRVDSAQTFTVGATGELSGFDIWVTRQQNVLQPLLFDVRRTLAGAPVDSNTGPDILASGQLPAESIAESRPFDPPSGYGPLAAAIIDLHSPHLAPEALVHVDLDSLNIAVTQGEILAIVLRTEDPNDFRGIGYVWHGKSPGEYDGGSQYYRSSADNSWHSFDPFPTFSTDMAFRTYVQQIPEPHGAMLCVLAVLFGGVATVLSRRC